MAASFSTLPFRLIPAPLPSRPKQQLYTISSSLSTHTKSTRLPIYSLACGFGFAFAFAFGSHSPITRSKLTSSNSTPDETQATVETLETDETLATSVVDADEEAEAEAKPPFKPIVKLGDVMGILNKRAIEARDEERPIPDLRTGDIVQIRLIVPTKRRGFSIYKGIVMSKQNAGIHTTIRIRRIIAGIGVEIVFPVYSPLVQEIKVVQHRKVRRARLYYLRDKLPRFSTFK